MIVETDTQTQWETLISYVKNYIKSPRQEALISLYEKLSDRILTSPASSHTTRHNCWPGGYVDHVNRVVKCALELHQLWNRMGLTDLNYTEEELVFVALNHDLGKIGTDDGEYYVPNDSDWHVKRGQVYKLNHSIHFMKVPDRSLYILQDNNIKVSEREFLSIKLHDGLYSKGNESYLMTGLPELGLKTRLPIIIHHADHLAALIEESNFEVTQKTATENSKVKSKLTKINDPVADESLKTAFKEIFG